MNNYHTIFINGEAFNCCNSMSLQQLLLYLNFDTSRILVEYNYAVVSNDNFSNINVQDQDKLEVVTIVGGG